MDEDDLLSHGHLNPRTRARCPECKTWLELPDAIELWDQVTCTQCEVLLELNRWHPATLSVVEFDTDFGTVTWDW